MVHSAAGVAMPGGGLVQLATVPGAPSHQLGGRRWSAVGRTRSAPARSRIAHGGVLFLDELAEFAPTVLDGLREPLEEGVIRVSRASCHAVLPARFQLVAATNPCPCGGGAPGACECDEVARMRYLRRLSGPLLDRFDLRVAVQRPGVDDLLDPGGGEPTTVVAERVGAARALAVDRAGRLNADLHGELLDRIAPLTAAARASCCGRRSSAGG